MKKSIVVANPSSGKKEAKDHAYDLKEVLEKSDQKVEILLTESKEDIGKFSKKACEENADQLYLLGGDGTVSEGLNAIKDESYKPVIGIIPNGTVNNIARGLSIPADPKEAIESLEASAPQKMDVGLINNQLFISSVSAGAIPETVWEVSDDWKEKIGPLAYFFEGFRKVNNEESYTFEMEIDGQKETIDLNLLLIGVSSSIARMNDFFKGASYSDGKLYFLGVKPSTLGEKISDFKDFFHDNQSLPKESSLDYRTFSEAKFKMMEEETNVALDGEKGPEFPIHLKVYPSHFNVLRPE